MKIPWTYIQSRWDWLGHIVEALVMSIVTAALFALAFPINTALLLGLAFSAGHFHGREKRDYEISEEMQPPHLKGYLMWRWNWDQATDFWPTACVLALIALLIR